MVNNEPYTLKSIQCSINRFLAKRGSAVNIVEDAEFKHFWDVLKSKRKLLRQQGKGNQEKRADPLTQDEMDILYSNNFLGGGAYIFAFSQSFLFLELEIPYARALSNTVYLNNSVYFGMRSRTEHVNLRWENIEFKETSTGEKFLELSERATKTRTGVTDETRAFAPKMFEDKDMMDLKHVGRLRQQHEAAVLETESKIKQWQKFKSDYEALHQRLTTLPDKISHEVMVPFGSLAFMPGRLVHTNEVLVLLGDNWFADRSAKQAAEIVMRRIKNVDRQIEDLQAQKKLLEPRLEFSSNLMEGTMKQNYFEITEEYDPEKEKLWREEHRKSVQRQRQQEKKAINKEARHVMTDEEMWERLDYLERQEAEGQEMKWIPNSGVESSQPERECTSEKSRQMEDRVEPKKECTQEKLRQTEDRLDHVSNPINLSHNRRVHFESGDSLSDDESDDDSDDYSGDFSDNTEETSDTPVLSSRITFTHSAEENLHNEKDNHTDPSDISEIRSPRDIYKLYTPTPKSILKKSSNPQTKVKVKKKTDSRVKSSQSTGPVAFSGLVVEKQTDTVTKSNAEKNLPSKQDTSATETPARISRFKAQRQKLTND